VKKGAVRGAPGRLVCSFCGAEVLLGEPYWYINGAVICRTCLPDFARQDYLPYRHIRGRGPACDDA